MSLTEVVNKTIITMQNSADLLDDETTASIMVLIDAIKNSPKEVLALEDLSLLAIALSATVSSGFVKRHPRYYDYSTGEIACSVGFYAFMKQLEHGTMLNAHFPAFIALLHDGREYLAELIEKELLSKVKGQNSYDPYFILEYRAAGYKKYAIIKGIELLIHVTCENKGYSDYNLERWKLEIQSEIIEIKQRIGNDFFKYALDLYKFITNNLKSDSTYDFCLIE